MVKCSWNKKKKTKKNNNIRCASAAGTLESFYRDGAIGTSLHLQEPPLKGHLWELLWSLLHCRYLGPEKPLGRAWGVLGADWLKSDRTWNPADITSPLVHGIHHHINGHTQTRTASAPSMFTSFLIVVSILCIESHDIAKKSYQDMHFCFGCGSSNNVSIKTAQKYSITLNKSTNKLNGGNQS